MQHWVLHRWAGRLSNTKWAFSVALLRVRRPLASSLLPRERLRTCLSIVIPSGPCRLPVHCVLPWTAFASRPPPTWLAMTPRRHNPSRVSGSSNAGTPPAQGHQQQASTVASSSKRKRAHSKQRLEPNSAEEADGVATAVVPRRVRTRGAAAAAAATKTAHTTAKQATKRAAERATKQAAAATSASNRVPSKRSRHNDSAASEGLAGVLQEYLQARADSATRAWYTNYVKGASFRGLKMPVVRACVKTFVRDHSHTPELGDRRARLAFALDMIRLPLTEDKLAGMILIKEHDSLPVPADLPRLLALYEANLLADWNVCDWFCYRVLHPMVERHGETVIKAVAHWVSSPNLWARRAACVAFVRIAKNGNSNFDGFAQLMLDTAETALVVGGRDASGRFAQTGAGWMLRELALGSPDAVKGFLRRQAGLFTREGMRYATEKMAAGDRKRFAGLVVNG
eukprot:m.458787 g.458787  ORF g.458787 m.458787 type:complete len:455 (+) comp20337_c2_seq38:1686-3050(+)